MRSLKNDRRGSAGATAVKIILTVLVIAIIALYPNQMLKYLMSGLEGYKDVPKYSEFEVVRGLTLEVDQGEIEANLTLPYPNDIFVYDENGEKSYIQKVVSVKSNPKWNDKRMNKWGDTILVWNRNIGSDDALQVEICYHVKAYSTIWDVDTGTSGNVEDISRDLVRQYCHDEWRLSPEESQEWGGLEHRIAPSNEQIRNKALELTQDKKTVYSKLQAIYDWMDDNFEYKTGIPGMPKNCIQTLEEKSGDCDDQSILFISLARAIDIPAWLEAGALYNPNSNLDYNGDGLSDAWEGHAWANVYIPLEGGGSKMATVDVVNNLFLRRDTNRFSEWSDNGDSKRLEEYYTLWEYSYRSGLGTPEVSQGEYYITDHFESTGDSEAVLRI